MTTSGIDDVEASFRFMQTGKHQGKLVIDVGMEDKVTPNLTCDGNAAYIIAGGLGGIGQSIAAWLVDRGARTLLVLSRSGAKGPEAMKFINSLQSKGERAIAPSCDISNESVLRKVLEEWQPQLPPIKGCIQAAMVFQDRTFEMGMAFFILLSSISGIIGTHGQANYAAGNSFPDAPSRPLHGYELDCQPSIGAQPEVRETGSAAANWPEKPLFKRMTLDEAHSRDLASRGRTFQLAAAMENARPLPEGNHAVTRALSAKLSRALALDEKDIDPDKHISTYNVDSLGAVELRTWFASELKANIAVFDIIGSTVATIAQLAASRSKLQKGYST
ncbi:KR domain-containing protein [Aspergillus transmontanensis]|uniref:KR domain-containing protein n=1 Tax=Aspergillus transmontanensis TaxID=1034304 RepID=A0A5N6VJZ2_9EURO|nr:KR domain-containing protein [Aspergillus transmontanensis]